MSRFFNFWGKKDERSVLPTHLGTSSQQRVDGPAFSSGRNEGKTNRMQQDGVGTIYERFDLQFVVQTFETAECYIKVGSYCMCSHVHVFVHVLCR